MTLPGLKMALKLPRIRARWLSTAPFGAPVVPPVKKMAAGLSLSTLAAGIPLSAMLDAGTTFTPCSFVHSGANSSRTKRAEMSNFMQQPMTACSGRADGNIMAT